MSNLKILRLVCSLLNKDLKHDHEFETKEYRLRIVNLSFISLWLKGGYRIFLSENNPYNNKISFSNRDDVKMILDHFDNNNFDDIEFVLINGRYWLDDNLVKTQSDKDEIISYLEGLNI